MNGPIKYALDKGKFCLQDEDGREFKMVIVEKALVTPLRWPNNASNKRPDTHPKAALNNNLYNLSTLG